jgi:hypothetical protein
VLLPDSANSEKSTALPTPPIEGTSTANQTENSVSTFPVQTDDATLNPAKQISVEKPSSSHVEEEYDRDPTEEHGAAQPSTQQSSSRQTEVSKPVVEPVATPQSFLLQASSSQAPNSQISAAPSPASKPRALIFSTSQDPAPQLSKFAAPQPSAPLFSSGPSIWDKLGSQLPAQKPSPSQPDVTPTIFQPAQQKMLEVKLSSPGSLVFSVHQPTSKDNVFSFQTPAGTRAPRPRKMAKPVSIGRDTANIEPSKPAPVS